MRLYRISASGLLIVRLDHPMTRCQEALPGKFFFDYSSSTLIQFGLFSLPEPADYLKFLAGEFDSPQDMVLKACTCQRRDQIGRASCRERV